MSEINPTDHKSMTDHHFPDEDFRGEFRVCKLDESERDNKQVEGG